VPSAPRNGPSIDPSIVWPATAEPWERATLIRPSKSSSSLATSLGPLRRPRLLAVLAAASLVACTALAYVSVRRERAQAIASADAALLGLGRVADALWQADDARIHALLARLRIELRSDADWSKGPATASGDAPRHIDTLLRRALEGAADVRSIDWIVAGQEGLNLARIEPGPRSRDESEDADATQARADRATELWYADDVQAAVAANGRRIVRGPVEFVKAGEEERPIVRVALALHDAEDVVQGALVAELDLQPLARRLSNLSSESVRLAVATHDGRVLADNERPPGHGFEAGMAGLTGESAGEAPPIVEEGSFRSLVRAVPQMGEEPGKLVFWLEHDGPAPIGARLVRSGWAAALTSMVLLVAALLAWDRVGAGERTTATTTRQGSAGRRARESKAPAGVFARRVEGDSKAGPRDSDANGEPDAGSDAITREAFVLRDWLADVRGCLEREAASRGLTLDLRCERGLPRQLEQDPSWLGGLLVSLGREALDATRASRVALEVFEEGAGDLRFELDAGETEIVATPGADEIAFRLGAVLEPCGRGRLAIRLPGAFA
jgi:hypothetical protein